MVVEHARPVREPPAPSSRLQLTSKLGIRDAVGEVAANVHDALSPFSDALPNHPLRLCLVPNVLHALTHRAGWWEGPCGARAGDQPPEVGGADGGGLTRMVRRKEHPCGATLLLRPFSSESERKSAREKVRKFNHT